MGTDEVQRRVDKEKRTVMERQSIQERKCGIPEADPPPDVI